MLKRIPRLLLWMGMLVFTGCSPNYMNLAELNYQKLAHRYSDFTDLPPLPVIFLPGMKGSQIVKCNNDREWNDHWPCEQKDEIDVWGTSGNVALFRKYDDLMLAYQFGKIAKEFGTPGETIPNVSDYKKEKNQGGRAPGFISRRVDRFYFRKLRHIRPPESIFDRKGRL